MALIWDRNGQAGASGTAFRSPAALQKAPGMLPPIAGAYH